MKFYNKLRLQDTAKRVNTGRDTGNDFFVPQIPGCSVSIPGTLNVG